MINRLSKGQKKVLLAIYILLGIKTYVQLYFGQSSFFTTTYTYSLLAIVCYYALKKSRSSANAFLIAYSLLFTLFTAEVVLRFIVRYPLTYSEQNGGDYIILYRYNKKSNIRFKYLEGRKDIYTLQFDSGEIRDNNCGDYHYSNDTCNALGFRGALPDRTKKIILTLGDSFTEGAGAPADSSIPALLRKYIVHQDPFTDVLNAGVSGNDIFFDWQMVHKLEGKYQLKQLIFIMNTTDINDVSLRGGSERFRPNGFLEYKRGVWWEPIYAVSFVFRLCINNALKLDYNLQTAIQREKSHNEAINQICSLVKTEIHPWSMQKGVNVVIVLHPLRDELQSDEKAIEYHKLLSALQQKSGVEILDCMPMLKAVPDTYDLYWKNDLHFKPVGYNMIAEYMIKNIYQSLSQDKVTTDKR